MGGISADHVREIESLVHDWVHDNDVPGASIVVVDSGGECYAEGFGARDLDSNASATPDTLYGVGSITKPFTALAVTQLAEAGHLSVSDPVNEYVDHYAEAPGDPITIAELLSHTSGMPATNLGILAQTFDGVPAGVADEDDRERLVREATVLRVTNQERFLYYNTGYDVLGRVIEAVDGRQYAEYVRAEILDPLGMDRSTFHRGEFEAEDDAMTGYGGGEEGPEPEEFPFEELIYPSGGLVSSARELSRFVRAMMTDGALDGSRVTSEEVIERCQQGRAVRQTYLDGTDQKYGYGWMRRAFLDDTLMGHGGSIGVSTAYAGFLEDAQIGVAIACNTSAKPHPMELGAAALAVTQGEPPTVEPAFAIKEKCEAVTGDYEAFRGRVTATVEETDGGISVTLSGPWGEDEFTAFPVSLDPADHEFYTVTGDGARTPVEFDLASDPADLFYGRFRGQRA